jgi:hypothetical protein
LLTRLGHYRIAAIALHHYWAAFSQRPQLLVLRQRSRQHWIARLFRRISN